MTPWFLNYTQDCAAEYTMYDGRLRQTLCVPKSPYRSALFSSIIPGGVNGALYKNLPSSANGNNYCIINRRRTNDDDYAYNVKIGMEWEYILILEGHTAIGISCEMNSSALFQFNNVTEAYARNVSFYYETSERFALTNVPTKILTKNHDINWVHFEKMTNATAPSTIQWITYVPTYANIYPTFENGWEVFGLLLLIILYAAVLYTIYFYGTQYAKKRNPMHLKHLFAMLVWLIWLILFTFTSYYEIYDETVSDRFLGVSSVIYGFCTLFSVTQTVSMLVGVAGQTPEVNYMIYGSVFFAHIALNGSNYLYYVYKTTQSPSVKNNIQSWALFTIWWNIFALTIIISPVFYLIYKVVIKTNANNRDNERENGGPLKRLERLLRMDMKVTAMLAIYFLSILFWLMLKFLISFSSVTFRDDRVKTVFSTLSKVFFMTPYVVNAFFLDHVPGKI
jgi:hypothetical protein